MKLFSTFSVILLLRALSVSSAAQTPSLEQLTDDSEASIVAVGGLSKQTSDTSINSIGIISQCTGKPNTNGVSPPNSISMFGSVYSVKNQQIYVVGGDYKNSFWSYDPALKQNIWVSKPNFPEQTAGLTLVIPNDNTLVALGGLNSTRQPMANVYSYQFSNNLWSLVGRVPLYSSFPCAVTTGGNIYFIAEGSLFRSTDVGKTWTQLSSVKVGSRLMSCVVSPNDSPVPNTIFVIGGLNDKIGTMDNVHAYDIAQNSWSELAPLTRKRLGAAAVYLPAITVGCSKNPTIVVCGGSDQEDSFSDCESYDFQLKQWSKTSYTLDQPRAFFGLLAATASVATNGCE